MGRHSELPQKMPFLLYLSQIDLLSLLCLAVMLYFLCFTIVPLKKSCVSVVQGVPGEAGAAGVTGPRVSWRTAFNYQLFRDWTAVRLDADCLRWCAGRARIPWRERRRRPSGSAGTTRSARNSRNRWTQGEAHISSAKWWIMNSLSPAGGHKLPANMLAQHLTSAYRRWQRQRR